MESNAKEKNQMMAIDVDLISENPFQPRKEFNEKDIDELSESIKTHGLIQPVILRNIGERYQIVAGERRLRAFKRAGFKEIPAIITKIDGLDVAEVSLIENIQRKDLNCLEEAGAFNIMKIKFGMTADDIAKRIGKSRSYVSNILRLISLPDSIKSALISGSISMGHGRALLSIESVEDQDKALQLILRNSMSVRQTEDLVTKMLGDARPKKSKRKGRIAETLAGDIADYYNSIKSVIKDIKKAGGRADVIERETDEYLEITVRISK